jgi:hypothetical protein
VEEPGEAEPLGWPFWSRPSWPRCFRVGGVLAQEPGQVTGLAVEQQHGFATLSWNPVEGVTAYAIERTPVNESDEPIGPPVTTGVWRPNRQVNQESPAFADAGFNPGDRFSWRVRALPVGGLPNQVTIDPPSAAAGTYGAAGASFGPSLDDTGLAGDIVVVDDGTDSPTEGCGGLVGFPAGAVALADRGGCTFVQKVNNAQDAGAIAVIVANNTGGDPINMSGSDPGITIPSVMVSLPDGNMIKAGLPATGRVQRSPQLPFSDPVTATTLPQWGDPEVPGENLRTQWEETQGAQFTSDVNEYAYTAAIDEASDRVRVVEIGRTVLNRPINMFIIGHPAPQATAQEVASSPSTLINCNVHGNEPSSREACLIMARELAFSDDSRIVDILSNATVLIVPTINGDGRAANTRGNSTGQDLNRDYSLIRQPETFGFVQMMRDYQPKAAFDGHEFGNSQAGDLPVLPPRHLNVAQPIFDESKSMIEEWLYANGSADGWWYCPYGCQGGGSVGLSQETILRNTMGLKNVIGSLLEARSAGGLTRPDEGNAQNNRRRKAYSALYTYHQFLDFYRANQPAIAQAREEAIEFQTSNTGPIVFRGSRPIPAFPPPHPGESPPPEENPSSDQILEDPPCGYLLSEEQYKGPRTDGPVGMRTTVAQRIEAHGWRVQRRNNGYLVPLAQPERGLIPLLLDAQAAEEWVGADRMYPPPEFPEGKPVPDGACGRGIRVPSAERAEYDKTYDTD